MRIWQADFYRRPQTDIVQEVLWELLICDASRSFEYQATCPQKEANGSWVTSQIQSATVEKLPDVIQVFRPQSLGLIQQAGQNLGISVEQTRRTFALKQWLQEKHYPISLDNHHLYLYRKSSGENNGALLHSHQAISNRCLDIVQSQSHTCQNFSYLSI